MIHVSKMSNHRNKKQNKTKHKKTTTNKQNKIYKPCPKKLWPSVQFMINHCKNPLQNNVTIVHI